MTTFKQAVELVMIAFREFHHSGVSADIAIVQAVKLYRDWLETSRL